MPACVATLALAFNASEPIFFKRLVNKTVPTMTWTLLRQAVSTTVNTRLVVVLHFIETCEATLAATRATAIYVFLIPILHAIVARMIACPSISH
jgi:hypothetical protein